MGPTVRRVVPERLEDGFSRVWQYLDYEEPPFNDVEGLTNDYFTDDYVGFYTKKNRALSFEWVLTNKGEVPWAGMVVGFHSVREGCGAVLLTEQHVMTPCPCVRKYIYESIRREDHDYAYDNRALFYESDQGLEIYVVIDTVGLSLDLLEQKKYPKIIEVTGADRCFHYWDTGRYTPKLGHYAGYYEPAVLKFAPVVQQGVAVPWPPIPIAYDNGPFKDPNLVPHNFQYYDRKDKNTYLSQYVSFKLKPFEHDVKSWDNFNKEIRFEDRQIELYLRMCSQTNCRFIKEFKIFQESGLQELKKNLLCWCDDPSPEGDVVFQNWRESEIPHFLYSVFGGLRGSPIVHKGGLAGWGISHVVYGELSDAHNRSTLSRGVNVPLIEYIESKLPSLHKGNRPNVHDRNRPSFAIHDQKLFLPDPDLTEEDVDIYTWSLQGESLRHSFSSDQSISPGQNFILGISVIQYLLVH